jgi:hypothetical protein
MIYRAIALGRDTKVNSVIFMVSNLRYFWYVMLDVQHPVVEFLMWKTSKEKIEKLRKIAIKFFHLVLLSSHGHFWSNRINL